MVGNFKFKEEMDGKKDKKGPPEGPTKTKEEILAERKAKKAEKQAKKSQPTSSNEKKPTTPAAAGAEPGPPQATKEGIICCHMVFNELG